MPARRFARQVRVIDTQNMCIVDLSDDDRYVALSYSWGQVEQLSLYRDNQALLRRKGGLTEAFAQLTRVAQDAIILVSKVGERFLWLDSLCIVQDDNTDLREQMHQMGEIFRHSYFTIFAISGKDANYGLPGVRQGSRKLKQVLQDVSGLTIANSLPLMEEGDLTAAGAWGTRAWTFQEKLRAQRGLHIGDNGMILNCLHIYSPEDEHCWHTLTRNERQIADGDNFFYTGMDKRCKPYFDPGTRFEIFAQIMSEYSKRSLTYQSDALHAFLGVLDTLDTRFSSGFIHCLPEGEFDASLLWSPIGSSIRRCDPDTKQPLFPSWSWLGWTGHAAYPWAMERDTFTSTETSPLEWQDAVAAQTTPSDRTIDSPNRKIIPTDGHEIEKDVDEEGESGWFTSEDLCLPASPERENLLRSWLIKTEDHLGARTRAENLCPIHDGINVEWPHGRKPEWQYIFQEQHLLTFRTLSAKFYLGHHPYKRKRLYNMQHPIWRMGVMAGGAGELKLAGYIDIPDPNSDGRKFAPGKKYEFIVLSRSTVDGKFEPFPDPLVHLPRDPRAVKQHASDLGPQGDTGPPINPKGGFDEVAYDPGRPWCMLNVMMLSYDGTRNVNYREAIGRIHVDAFLAQEPRMRKVRLE